MLFHDLRRPNFDRTSHAVTGDFAPGDAIFFTIKPPANTTPCLSRLAWHLRDKHRLDGKPLRPQCFHISLLFAGYHGRLPQATLAALTDSAATIRMPSFRVAFDWVVSFRNGQRRALVLRGDDGVGGLFLLRDRLIAAAMDVPGLPAARSSFTPHLTLLYDERELREAPVEEIAWPVSEFALVRSVYGEARHIMLGRWSLRG